MATASERYVLLHGGLAVPLEPMLLLLDLEARDLQVSRAGDDLLVRPPGQLTDADRVALRRWKAHVLALVDYAPPEVM
jgi:hypothetical protein